VSDQVPTIKTREGRTRSRALGPGEVSLERLKRELDRGFEHFKAKRPHLHFDGQGGRMDFSRRAVA
jgi:hypothetical protein